MPLVFPPPAMKDLFEGREHVQLEAANVRELIAAIESRFPGAQTRLVENGQLRSGIAVVVNGRPSSLGMQQPLEADDEVHFLPALGGG